MRKVLIIRLSSFGDVVQAMAAPKTIKSQWPEAKVDWLVRSDFKELLEAHPFIDTVIAFDRKQKLSGYLKLCIELSKNKYTHVYDAHNNMRSRILGLFLLPRRLVFLTKFVRRSKQRLDRILLFKFQINRFPKPYVAQDSFLQPLQKWGLKTNVVGPHFFIPAAVQNRVDALLPSESFACAVPSAAWVLKRWPISYWKDLLLLSETKNWAFLGGPDDAFIDSLCASVPNKIIMNFRGKLSLLESCAVLNRAKIVISNDTGLLHVADQLEKPTVALIGPTAFGYPKSTQAQVAEIKLFCKPCSKDGSDPCKHPMQQKCMKDIKPHKVLELMRNMK
jgi:ADP-heptose:LPS heptosyltransferase